MLKILVFLVLSFKVFFNAASGLDSDEFRLKEEPEFNDRVPKRYVNYYCDRDRRQILEIDLKILIPILAEKLSFLCQFNDMIFHKFLPGRMVFLYGTSTAGKSSITAHLKTKAKLKNLDLVVTGTDTVWGLHIFDLFVHYSSEKASTLHSYFNIEEIFDCLWNPLLVSKLINEKSIKKEKGIEIEIILDEFRGKQNDLLKDLSLSRRPLFCASSFLPALSLGKEVIVDTAADVGDIDEFFQAMLTQLVHCRTDTVIVYCSPKQLMERLYSRNEEALKTSSLNKGRPGAFPLKEYTVMYETTNVPCDAIDSINFSDTQVPAKLPIICKTLAGLISEQISSASNNYKDGEWQETQDLMRRSFDINDDRDRLIKPKCDYQFLVNTGEESSKACAEKILSTLRLCSPYVLD